MTYPDWREPVRLLQIATGSATPAQLALAHQVRLILTGREPHNVVAVLLEDHLKPSIWGSTPDSASDRQRAFLQTLGATGAEQPDLSKAVASAWIDHHLSLRTIESLRALRIVTGDKVIKRSIWTDPTTGELHEATYGFTVSSIGRDGLVYFRGGNGKCGWPSSLTRATSQQ